MVDWDSVMAHWHWDWEMGFGDGRFTTASTGQGPKRDLTRACGGEGKVRDSRREAVVRLRSCEFLG